MVSVGPSALSCVVPLRNIGLPAPDPTSTISKATRRGLNIDSIAALIVVKQLWRKRNLSPRGWVILAAPAPGRPPLRKRVQGLAVQYFLSLWHQVPTAVRDIHYLRTSTETRGSHFRTSKIQTTMVAASVPGSSARSLASSKHVGPGAEPMAGPAYRIQQSVRLKYLTSSFM